MNVITLLVVYIAWTMVSVQAEPDAPPACNSLKPVTIDYQQMTDVSPFTSYRSNLAVFNCTDVVYVKPSGGRRDYTGTGILLQGSNTFSYKLQLINNTLFKTVQCTTGELADFQTVFSRFRKVNAAFCVVSCADDGIGYNGVYCGGRTPDDEDRIQSYLDKNLKGVPGILNLQLNCPKSEYCDSEEI